MNFFDKEKIKEIDELMYNKALDTDVALYNLIFDEEKDPTFAETSLYLYVNSDGGFGHGLNPDNINPNSTVFETYEALKFFKESYVNNINQDEISKELLSGAFKFLSKRSRYSLKEKINDKFACALRFKGDDDQELTVGILGYTIYFYIDKKS